MTVLSAVQNACTESLSLAKPDTLFGSTRRDMVELQSIANAAAEYIARDHDWEFLKTKATIAGNGVADDFSLPDDYDRMLVKAGLWSSRLSAPLLHVDDSDRWLGIEVQGDMSAFGAWTMYQSRIHILPAPALSETVQYFYISNNIVRITVSEGVYSYTNTFTIDEQSFALSETLLKLAIVWMYKASKGREYAEDMATYEREKEKLVARDGGSKIIHVGRTRLPGAEFAYPLSVG